MTGTCSLHINWRLSSTISAKIQEDCWKGDKILIFSGKSTIYKIYGAIWQAYGNLQLLENPFKAPVVIHRADSESIKAAKCRRWQHLSENGGVVISPFISHAEKEIRRKCEEANGKVILLSTKPLGEREKPAAHDFEQCAAGRLLILAPMTALPDGRETFLYLNSIAESIAIPPNSTGHH